MCCERQLLFCPQLASFCSLTSGIRIGEGSDTRGTAEALTSGLQGDKEGRGPHGTGGGSARKLTYESAAGDTPDGESTEGNG